MTEEQIEYFCDRLATHLARVMQPAPTQQIPDMKIELIEQRLTNLEEKLVGVSDKVEIRKAFMRK